MQETQIWSLGREDPLDKGTGHPLQHLCLENPMDRGDWQATAHDITDSRTQLSN